MRDKLSSVRLPLDNARLQIFMEDIGQRARGPGCVYLVGGATALLLDIRQQTLDVDIKLDPEPLGVFDEIAQLKERLGINVELASPDHFVPPLPGWRERSEFIGKWGKVEFFHYDFYGQALAKIVRGHSVDLSDVRALVSLGKVQPAILDQLFKEVLPEFKRYPALNPDDVAKRVQAFLGFWE